MLNGSLAVYNQLCTVMQIQAYTNGANNPLFITGSPVLSLITLRLVLSIFKDIDCTTLTN